MLGGTFCRYLTYLLVLCRYGEAPYHHSNGTCTRTLQHHLCSTRHRWTSTSILPYGVRSTVLAKGAPLSEYLWRGHGYLMPTRGPLAPTTQRSNTRTVRAKSLPLCKDRGCNGGWGQGELAGVTAGGCAPDSPGACQSRANPGPNGMCGTWTE